MNDRDTERETEERRIERWVWGVGERGSEKGRKDNKGGEEERARKKGESYRIQNQTIDQSGRKKDVNMERRKKKGGGSENLQLVKHYSQYRYTGSRSGTGDYNKMPKFQTLFYTA